MCNVRLSQNTVCPSNLSKKVEPALKMFGRELTSGLWDEFSEKVKGTYLLLELINDYVMQSILTTNSHNHKHDLKHMSLKGTNGIRLKHTTKIVD